MFVKYTCCTVHVLKGFTEKLATVEFWRFIYGLEKVVINDAVPLKATQRDAIVNVKCFWASQHQRQ